MENNVSLEIFSVWPGSSYGMMKMEPDGPAGKRYQLNLPSIRDNSTKLNDLAKLVEDNFLGLSSDLKIDYLHIHDGKYSSESLSFLRCYLEDFPLSKNCRVSCPRVILFGDAS